MHGTRVSLVVLAMLGCTLAAAAAGASSPRGIGRMAVAPNILYAGSSGNQLTFTYTADSSSLRGQTLVEFPRGWTAPQGRNASGPGYVELRAGQCAASTKILSVGVRKVTIATNCKRHQSYQLLYSNVTAPQLSADGYVFLALTRSAAGGRKAKFRALLPGKQPVVKVKGGPPVRLNVQTTSVATTGTAFSITVRAVDAYGNNAYPYLGTVQLTSSDPAATMPAGYSYAATDAAQHTFPGAVLRTVGMQTITATDPTTGLTGTTPPIQVVPPS